MIVKKLAFRLAASWIACSMVSCGVAAATERIELASRAGITQPILFTAASTPIASVILFPGGNGVLSGLGGNFLIRVASQFTAAGMNVALVDVPSDHLTGMGTPFRSGEGQARDVAAVVAFLRSKSPVPVWVIGTSRGSISAANAARRLGPSQIAGVELTSAVWAGGMKSVPLGQIAVPTLIVHNHYDGCSEAPFDGATAALRQLGQAPAKELVAVSSAVGQGAPCGGTSPHGFAGAEGDVVASMVTWIKTHPSR